MTTEPTIAIAGRSSIEVSRYKDGAYGWVIKLYYGDDEPDQEVLARQYAIDQQLRQTYNGGTHS